MSDLILLAFKTTLKANFAINCLDTDFWMYLLSKPINYEWKCPFIRLIQVFAFQYSTMIFGKSCDGVMPIDTIKVLDYLKDVYSIQLILCWPSHWDKLVRYLRYFKYDSKFFELSNSYLKAIQYCLLP